LQKYQVLFLLILTATPDGGVTASVDIPSHLLTARSVVPPAALAPRPGLTPVPVGPKVIAADLGALDRAAHTMRELRPWNAFDLSSRGTADVRLAEHGSVAVPPTPHQHTPHPAGGGHLDQSSTLHRRVPGATLQSLQSTGPAGVAPMAASSAEQARDSLAQFESGVARAMRDLDQDEGRP